MSRMQKRVLAGGLSVLVLVAVVLTLIFGATRLAPIDAESLVGIWKDDASGSVLEFDAAGRVALTDFVYISTTTGERSPGHDSSGDWILDGESSSVSIRFDKPIEGISVVGFDSVTCGSETCLRYGPDDGTAQMFRRRAASALLPLNIDPNDHWGKLIAQGSVQGANPRRAELKYGG